MKNLFVCLTLIVLASLLAVAGGGLVFGGMANNHAWLFIGGVACCWASYCVVAGAKKVDP